MTACQAAAPNVAAPAAQSALSIIPEPRQLTLYDGHFDLTSATRVFCVPADKACSWIAGYLSDHLAHTRGMTLQRGKRWLGQRDAVVFERQAVSLGKEGYRLEVTPHGVTVSAGTTAGLFYGAVTLWQLATQSTEPATTIAIPAVEIEDSPRFAWRGILLDSARHFQSPAFVKSFIDAMALHKLDVLQWHLTDDQGWRLQIKRYPRLTSVGAWRTSRDGHRYGGFYTQNQVREIVAYAQRRHVTIVPEIEMPGHALAAIVSYPRLGSFAKPPRTVSDDWGVFPYLFNTNRSTFRFLENVLTEVMALFPSHDIHVGGDEAVKDQWNASPRIQAQMARLHIASADDLQGYFIDRIGKFLAAHGRRLVGWDEILNKQLARNAIVTSWRSIDSAVEGARLGHDVVLSPSPTLYFDNCQANSASEPPCRGTVISLKDVYDFDPTPQGLDAEQVKHIIGVQANVWTEHLRNGKEVEYATFPRAAALAEMAWSPQAIRNWQDFLGRMPAELARYRALGISHSESAWAVQVSAQPSPGGALVSLANQAGFGTIRYTLNGSAPTGASVQYVAPFQSALPAEIRAVAFPGGQRLSEPTHFDLTAASLLRRDSHQMALCDNDLPLARRAGSDVIMVDVMDPCWIYKGLDLSGIAGFKVSVAHLPFNYQIGGDIKKIPLVPDAPGAGELEVRLDTCTGPRLAVMPLDVAASRTGLIELHAKIAPHSGVHDLCFSFARRTVDPVWALDWVQPVAHAPGAGP